MLMLPCVRERCASLSVFTGTATDAAMRTREMCSNLPVTRSFMSGSTAVYASRPRLDLHWLRIRPHTSLWKRSQSSIHGRAGGDDLPSRHGIMPVLNPVRPTLKRDLIETFHSTFTIFERSFEIFPDATSFFKKHEALRHPPIFYLGHTASFYVNKLLLAGHIQQRVNAELEIQTAVGVDEMSWDDLDTGKYGWPTYEEACADPIGRAVPFLEKVRAFRRDVRAVVSDRMAQEPIAAPGEVLTQDSFWWLIAMGIEHENIHIETSAAANRQAERHLVTTPEVFTRIAPRREDPKDVPRNQMVTVAAASVTLGRTDAKVPHVFGFDNEFSIPVSRKTDALTVSKYLCSNAEFLEFIEAEGYQKREYWDEEGWNWVDGKKATMPCYWTRENGKFQLKILGDQIPMPWDWPAEVNCLEAEAFCRWKGKVRLLDEWEFAHVRNLLPVDIQDTNYGPKWELGSAGNVNMEQYTSPCAIDKNEHQGVSDVLGNVWQHSCTFVDVLPGFQPHPMYEDFTTPTIDGRHTRILGGSFLSRGANGATRDSRYGFRKHFQQFAGFRYTVGEVQPAMPVVPYSTGVVAKAMEFHFSTTHPKQTSPPAVSNYPEALAAIIDRHIQPTRTLEVMCGPGATSLALWKAGFDVIASDLNAAYFAPTEMFEQSGLLRWANVRDGELTALREIRQPPTKGDRKISWRQIPDYRAIDRRKIASNLGLVVMAQPDGFDVDFLHVLRDIVENDGFLVLGTPYDWSIPGVEGDTGPMVLENMMRDFGFEKKHGETVPFWMSDTERKFKFVYQDVTIWKRGMKGAEGETMTKPRVVAQIMEAEGQTMYGSDDVTSKYKEFHFGEESVEPVFPKACADITIDACKSLSIPQNAALELGGGPGRVAFELSRHFESVLGSDFEAQFVHIAQDVASSGVCEFNYVADACANQIIHRRYIAPETASKISFQEINAMEIDKDIGTFDLVCGFNLIDRLPHPAHFLTTQLTKVTKQGSLVVLSSPYTWVESFTPKSNWLGGYKYGDNGGPSSYDGLKETMLSAGFQEALPPQDQWFAIPDGSDRVFQRSKAQVTFWIKV